MMVIMFWDHDIQKYDETETTPTRFPRAQPNIRTKSNKMKCIGLLVRSPRFFSTAVCQWHPRGVEPCGSPCGSPCGFWATEKGVRTAPSAPVLHDPAQTLTASFASKPLRQPVQQKLHRENSHADLGPGHALMAKGVIAHPIGYHGPRTKSDLASQADKTFKHPLQIAPSKVFCMKCGRTLAKHLGVLSKDLYHSTFNTANIFEDKTRPKEIKPETIPPSNLNWASWSVWVNLDRAENTPAN